MRSLRHYFGVRERTLPDAILDEKLFSALLGMEQGRSDRSGRRFLLLFAEIAEPTGRNRTASERRFLRDIIDSLTGCARQTDLIGWYRQDAVIGVIFTEVSGDAAVRELIVSKVHRGLHADLKPAQVARLTLSDLLYPDEVRGAPGAERRERKA